MAKREVFVIKEDKEIVEGVFLSKGDMLIESGKGRWMIVEADGGDEEDDEKDKQEEAEGDKEDDKEDKEEADKKEEAIRAKKGK